jgi:hypothetical protein
VDAFKKMQFILGKTMLVVVTNIANVVTSKILCTKIKLSVIKFLCSIKIWLILKGKNVAELIFNTSLEALNSTFDQNKISFGHKMSL